MISRILAVCLACTNPATLRVQVGHEVHQPVVIACPNCGTPMRLTLLLERPPYVGVRWDENCAQGEVEGPVVNVGVGFLVARGRANEDGYFPSLDMPEPNREELMRLLETGGPVLIDRAMALGGLPGAAELWGTLRRAMRFRRTDQRDRVQVELQRFWEGFDENDETLEGTLFSFLMRFLAPNAENLMNPILGAMKQARDNDPVEWERFTAHFSDMASERFTAYEEQLDEYFRAYAEYNQTLVYVRNGLGMPDDVVATSTDFERTQMFYGNAFELLGSHIDFVAALNNMLSGRPFDQMNAMTLNFYRTNVNKANRTACFADNPVLIWFVAEYDSTIRNASHHRWFRLNEERTEISFRSGGNGALQTMSYADYLYKCNRLLIELMILASAELVLMLHANKTL